MATVTINEFQGVGQTSGGAVPVFAGGQTDQTAITSSASSRQSSSFGSGTRIVNVTSSGGDVRVKFGANPTATADSMLLPDGASVQYYTDGATEKVAVIDA